MTCCRCCDGAPSRFGHRHLTGGWTRSRRARRWPIPSSASPLITLTRLSATSRWDCTQSPTSRLSSRWGTARWWLWNWWLGILGGRWKPFSRLAAFSMIRQGQLCFFDELYFDYWWLETLFVWYWRHVFQIGILLYIVRKVTGIDFSCSDIQ